MPKHTLDFFGSFKSNKVEKRATTAKNKRKILEIKNLSKSYGDRAMVKNFTYTFRKGEKLGIAGPNGSGKTTLIRLLTGRELPDAGSVIAGETIVFGYFAQESLETIPTGKRVIEGLLS